MERQGCVCYASTLLGEQVSSHLLPKNSRNRLFFYGKSPHGVRIPVQTLRKDKKTAPCWVLFFYGGETGIRTLERVLAVTRFPVVRLRPAQPSLHPYSVGRLATALIIYHTYLCLSSIFLKKSFFVCHLLTRNVNRCIIL